MEGTSLPEPGFCSFPAVFMSFIRATLSGLVIGCQGCQPSRPLPSLPTPQCVRPCFFLSLWGGLVDKALLWELLPVLYTVV